jgi:glycosyltransferase involved in cell wall biosynthesis
MLPPLATIGMPVYNGGDLLRRALDSVLAQTHPHFEVVVSDNASTDGRTAELLTEYARRDARLRVTRQSVNLGPTGNFLWVLEQARGEHFMWAAHDDAWSPGYLAALCAQLDAAPAAVLAAGVTEVQRRVPGSESLRTERIPQPPAGDRWTVFDAFLADAACPWFYGVYRTDWLRDHALRLQPLTTRTADRIWLTDVLLNEQVVGSPDAVFYYTSISTKGATPTRRKRRTLHDLSVEVYYVGRSILGLPRFTDRWRAGRRLAWSFFPVRVSGRNPLGQLVRCLNLCGVGAWLMLDTAGRWVGVLARR